MKGSTEQAAGRRSKQVTRIVTKKSSKWEEEKSADPNGRDEPEYRTLARPFAATSIFDAHMAAEVR